MAEARGKFIQFLDADDGLKPAKLELQLRAIGSEVGPALAYCDYYVAREDDLGAELPEYYRSPKLRTPNHLKELAQRWETDLSIPCQCFLFDARLFAQDSIRFDERLPNHEDWDCWMRIFALKPPVCYVDAKLAAYRLHAASLSRDRRRMRRGFLQAIARQRARYGRDGEMRAVLAEKRSEIRRAYRDQTLFQISKRGLQRGWFPIRVTLGAAARTIAPGLVARLKKRRAQRRTAETN